MDLDDLLKNDFTEMSEDEAIELLRQIRLSRRMPVKKKSKTTKAKIKKEKLKAEITSEQAQELLKILGGN